MPEQAAESKKNLTILLRSVLTKDLIKFKMGHKIKPNRDFKVVLIE